ncbi:MAG TPA: hypothetical protein DIV54_00520 [Verrucomicrobiales bacterium]|nr:hypothetical protein [Verrucomicrobiales bacterium]
MTSKLGSRRRGRVYGYPLRTVFTGVIGVIWLFPRSSGRQDNSRKRLFPLGCTFLFTRTSIECNNDAIGSIDILRLLRNGIKS